MQDQVLRPHVQQQRRHPSSLLNHSWILLDEMGLADSFIMGVLRGWRLLQAASLNNDEKRDIPATTHNRIDYDSISHALQTLWDDQFMGQRHNQSGPARFMHVQK